MIGNELPFVGRLASSVAAIALACVLASPGVQAQQVKEATACKGPDVPAGTVIKKDTIDSLKDKCLQGKRIGDMIPERVEWAIRNYAYQQTIIPDDLTPAEVMPYRLIEATKKYAGQAQLDAKTLQVTNYTSGLPFPEIKDDDPLAAYKVIWNHRYGRPKGDQFGSAGTYTGPNFVYTLIGAGPTDVRIQRWNFSRIFSVGRVTGGPATLDNGGIYNRSLFFAISPQDIKGLGTFTIQYNTPKLDDIWAYIRTVRRIRRLSGGAWVDPIGGTDQLFDDIQGCNSNPAWYESFKIIGKTYAFHVYDSQRHIGTYATRAAWQEAEGSLKSEFPRLMADQWPGWNMNDVWMPRPYYVIEGIPPSFHAYSRKVLYYDAQNYNVGPVFAYDKKGDFWKYIIFAQREYETTDGAIDPRTGKPELWDFEAWGHILDYQIQHGTVFHVAKEFNINLPGAKPEDWTLATLEAVGR